MKWIAVPLLLLAVVVQADDGRDAKLWELILDPATPREVRRKVLADADFERTPEAIERAMKGELELRREAARNPQPWHGDVFEVLDHPGRSTAYPLGMELVRKIPCGTEIEEQVMLRYLEILPMTPESYGVLRNLVLRHDGKLEPKREWFGWADYWREDTDKWWASQAFVADLAPDADRALLKRLVRIVDRMRHEGDHTPRVAKDGVPNTALLVLLDRLDALAEEPKTRCRVAEELSFLLWGYGLPRLPREGISIANEMREYPMWDPDTHDVAECDAWLGEFRTWLETKRKAFEEGAAAEAEAIAKVRERMVAETLCR